MAMQIDEQHSGIGSIADLEHLADYISEVLGCPATIEDANHRLLAYSSHETPADPARLSTIVKRSVPEEVIAYLWNRGILQQLQQQDTPLRIEAISQIGLGARTAVAIREQGVVLGYIWVMDEQQQMEEAKLELLMNAARTAKEIMLRRRAETVRRFLRPEEFWRLLFHGYFDNDFQIRQHASRLQLILPEQMRVVLFEWEAPAPISSGWIPEFPKSFSQEKSINICGYMIDRKQLALLAAPQSDRSWEGFHRFVYDLADQLHVSGVICGAGSLVRGSLMDVARSFREAHEVLMTKKRFPQDAQTFLCYEELGFYLYLPAMERVRSTLGVRNAALDALEAYDREHKTELVKTLEAYLSCDSNVRLAASKLHIHVNTLSYRLARIAEVGGIDLKNMNEKVTLYLELKLRSGKDP